MARVGWLVAVSGLVVCFAVPGTASVPPAVPSAAAAAVRSANCQSVQGALVGVDDYTHADLELLNPTTLSRLARHRLRLPSFPTDRFVGGGGCRMVLGDVDGSLLVVNLARLALVRQIRVNHTDRLHRPEVRVVSWPRRHRVVAYGQPFEAHTTAAAHAYVIDPVAGKVRQTVALHRTVVAAARDGLGDGYFLTEPTDGVGPTKLTTLTPNGQSRSLELGRITSGFRVSGYGRSVERSPSLVVRGHHAYVVGAHEPVADIDLHTQLVSYHHVSRLMGVTQDAGPPQTPGSAGELRQHGRQVQVVDRHHLLVTGGESRVVDHGRKIQDVVHSPDLLDLRTWQVTKVFRRVSYLQKADGLLFGQGASRLAKPIPTALTAYTLNGKHVYTLPNRGGRRFDFAAGLMVRGALDGSHATLLNPRTAARIRSLGKPAIWPIDVTRIRPNAVTIAAGF